MTSCLLSLLMASMLDATCPKGLYTGLERPYAFLESVPSPLSTRFEQDTRAYIQKDSLSLNVDLWKIPVAGAPRTPTGIDLWSLTIGVSF